jgi:OOP family OmpA-OmpF porin
MFLRILVIMLVSIPVSAWAQSAKGSFNLNRFDPSERGSEWFLNDSLDLRGHLRPAVGAVFDYGYKPLVIYNDNLTTRSALVEHQLMLNLGVNMVLWERWRIGFNLPIALFQHGEPGLVLGVQYVPPNQAALGDVRFGTDVRLFGVYGGPVQVAIGALLWLPTGRPDLYTGDGTVRLMPRASIAGDIAWFSYSASFGFHFRPKVQSFAVAPVGSELVLKVAFGAHLAQKTIMVGPEISASTVTSNPSGLFSARTATNIEALLGVHWRFVRDFRVGAGVGPGLSRGLGTPEVRALLGIEYVPQPIDKSVIVTEEGEVRERASSVQASPDDRDNDGVANLIDACPDVEGLVTKNPATNGCPDSDGDGFYDNLDYCPFVVGVAQPGKRNGCPLDRDLDGQIDAVDMCPDEPGPESSDRRINGCPDRDGDGIIDRLDRCPAQPGIRWSDPTRDGCPEK